jgi:C4-dicarboxylate-specific signal transduction histidine kinase
MLGELSGSLAHELNQPLTAILSNAQAAQQLLTRQTFDVGRIGEILAYIVDDDTRASKIIEGLRTLLKKKEASASALDLHGLVTEVMALVRRQCIERSVALTVEPSDDPAVVFGDRVQLQQILLNLIMNACEALEASAPAQLRIVISIERMAGDWIGLAVADTGAGIPDELLPRLFQPFTSTKPGGMGLGLSISRSIVKAHGGTLSAFNNRAGGATLQLRLPAIREDQP